MSTMTTETETVTKAELNSLPKKQLLIMAKELELGLPTNTLKDDVIEAILAVYNDADEMIEAIEEDEDIDSNEFGAVVAARSETADIGKQLIDVKTLTVKDLEAMRPDLVKSIRSNASKANDKADDTAYASLQKWAVQIGPIGPLTIEAYTRSDALQKFCEQSGVNGFSKMKPTITKIN